MNYADHHAGHHGHERVDLRYDSYDDSEDEWPNPSHYPGDVHLVPQPHRVRVQEFRHPQRTPRRRNSYHAILPAQAYVSHGRVTTPNLLVNIDNHNDELHGRESSPVRHQLDGRSAGARASVSDRMSHSDRMSQNICLHDGCASPRWPGGDRWNPGWPYGGGWPGCNWQDSYAVEHYKAQMREEEEKRKAAVERAKLDMEKAEAARKAAEKDAVAAYKKSEEEKKAELETKKTEWELKLAKKKEDEKAMKKAWAMDEWDKQQTACGMIGYPPYTSPGDWCTETGPQPIKVHRDRISIETLRHYQIPWRYHESDTDYIMIETPDIDLEILYDHTRRLRYRESPVFTRRHEDQLYLVRKPPRRRWRW